MKAYLAIIRAELWQRRWALVWWSIGITVFLALNLSFYPSFRDQASEADKAFANLPDSLKALFTDTGDFLSPVGYLSSQIYYLLLPLLLSILAIGMGAGMLANEEKQGTLELLLARPVSRTKLLVGKATAGLLGLSLAGFVALVVCVIGVRLAGFDVSRKAVALTTFTCVCLALLLGAVSFLFSALGKMTRGVAIAVAALIGFGSYIISSLAGTIHWLQWPAKALPFHYYRPAEMLGGTTTSAWAALSFMGIAVALLVLAWVGFRRRDIGN